MKGECDYEQEIIERCSVIWSGTLHAEDGGVRMNIDLLKPKNSPLVHYDLEPDFMRWDLEGNMMKYMAQIQAKVVDLHEAAIVDAVIAEARAAGMTDLYLLDREFVLSAITEKITREQG